MDCCFILWVGATLAPLVTSMNFAFIIEILISLLFAVSLALTITVSDVSIVFIVLIS